MIGRDVLDALEVGCEIDLTFDDDRSLGNYFKFDPGSTCRMRYDGYTTHLVGWSRLHARTTDDLRMRSPTYYYVNGSVEAGLVAGEDPDADNVSYSIPSPLIVRIRVVS